METPSTHLLKLKKCDDAMERDVVKMHQRQKVFMEEDSSIRRSIIFWASLVLTGKNLPLEIEEMIAANLESEHDRVWKNHSYENGIFRKAFMLEWLSKEVIPSYYTLRRTKRNQGGDEQLTQL